MGRTEANTDFSKSRCLIFTIIIVSCNVHDTTEKVVGTWSYVQPSTVFCLLKTFCVSYFDRQEKSQRESFVFWGPFVCLILWQTREVTEEERTVCAWRGEKKLWCIPKMECFGWNGMENGFIFWKPYYKVTLKVHKVIRRAIEDDTTSTQRPIYSL